VTSKGRNLFFVFTYLQNNLKEVNDYSTKIRNESFQNSISTVYI